MLKSKRIHDFFSAELDALRSEHPIPFDVHLYFEATDHILVWQPAGTLITDEIIHRYRDRGVQRIWIHSSEKETFDSYIKGDEPQTPPSARNAAEAPLPYDSDKTREALTNPDLDLAARQQDAAEGAQNLLTEASSAQTLEQQAEANRRLRERIRDLIEPGETFDLVEKISELEHSVDTAVYAVVFAMLCGHVDRQRLCDLAVAGLVHDVGLCLLPLSVLRTPWSRLSQSEHTHYVSHVRAGLDWLARNAPEITAAQCDLVDKHHEKFDATGYPQGVGFQEHELSQFLAVSELVLSMSSGKVNGRRCTLKEAVHAVVELDVSYAGYSNPEVFAVVARWCQAADEDKTLSTARKITHEQKNRLFRNTA